MRKKIVLALGALAVVALALPVANLLDLPKDTPLTKRADKAALPAHALLEARCAHCHVAGTRRPFYAVAPVVSSLVEYDVAQGLSAFDLVAQTQAHALGDEVALAKLEHAIEGGTMPPLHYLALHWRARLGTTEKETVLAAVRASRAQLFAPAGVPAEVQAGILHPLPASLPVDPAKVALGQKLYDDKRLSADDTLSCASCHDLAKGGTDQAPVSTGIRGQKGPINAPTTFNAAFMVKQFWDGRADTLEAQAGGPPLNPIEMGSTWEQIVGKLSADPALAAEFKALYPEGITPASITDAIAAFERTLLTPNSRFDRFLLGDAKALDETEQLGYRTFKETGCATCHVGKILGGQSFEKMGRKADYFARRPITEADHGRYNATRQEADRHRFKVPTLRNVAKTHPYFHDGSAATLQEAVETMARVQHGRSLTQREAQAITKFLESLTGEYRGKML